jgi:hypothetical protein
MDNATMKAAIFAANENLLHVRQAFYRHEATYEEMQAAATQVLELRIAARGQVLRQTQDEDHDPRHQQSHPLRRHGDDATHQRTPQEVAAALFARIRR